MYFAKDIEQLEEAARQLDKNTTTSARLALLLTDNVAELLMYRRVQSVFLEDDLNVGTVLEDVIPPKYGDTKRKKVEKYFNDKVNFLMNELGVLNCDAGSVFKVGHSLRNEAYHNGVLRDTIVVSVSRVYFQTVCEVMSQLCLGVGYWVMAERAAEEILARYGIAGRDVTPDVLAQVTAKIGQDRACPLEQLLQDLRRDVTERVDETIQNVDYLIENSYGEKPDRDAVLRRLQFWDKNRSEIHEQYREIEKQRPRELTDETRAAWMERERRASELSHRIEQREAQYRPPVTLRNLQSWKRQAERWLQEKLAGSALEKWHNTDKKLLKIEALVNRAVDRLDFEIDLQIHP